MTSSTKAAVVEAALTGVIVLMMLVLVFDRPFRVEGAWCLTEGSGTDGWNVPPHVREYQSGIHSVIFRLFLRDTDAPSLTCDVDGPDTYRLLWTLDQHVKIVSITATPDANWIISSAHYLTKEYGFPQVVEKRPARWLSDAEVRDTVRAVRRDSEVFHTHVLPGESVPGGPFWLIDSRVKRRFGILLGRNTPTPHGVAAGPLAAFFLKQSGLREH